MFHNVFSGDPVPILLGEELLNKAGLTDGILVLIWIDKFAPPPPDSLCNNGIFLKSASNFAGCEPHRALLLTTDAPLYKSFSTSLKFPCPACL